MSATGLFASYPLGATPLSPDDQLGLIPPWVATRRDLNFVEAENISHALVHYSQKLLAAHQILDDLFVRTLHKSMFGNVWTWAGKYRRLETSIGVAPEQISQQVVLLMEDAKYWIAAVEGEELDQQVARIHHRLVAVHPFPNGNGRMSRLFADLLLQSLRRPPFSWGANLVEAHARARPIYLNALKRGDAGDLSALYQFVRS